MTEAKAQEADSGPWKGWPSLYREGGIEEKQQKKKWPWGTIVSSSRYELKQFTTVKKRVLTYQLDLDYPGALVPPTFTRVKNVGAPWSVCMG